MWFVHRRMNPLVRSLSSATNNCRGVSPAQLTFADHHVRHQHQHRHPHRHRRRSRRDGRAPAPDLPPGGGSRRRSRRAASSAGRPAVSAESRREAPAGDRRRARPVDGAATQVPHRVHAQSGRARGHVGTAPVLVAVPLAAVDGVAGPADAAQLAARGVYLSGAEPGAAAHPAARCRGRWWTGRTGRQLSDGEKAAGDGWWARLGGVMLDGVGVLGRIYL